MHSYDPVLFSFPDMLQEGEKGRKLEFNGSCVGEILNGFLISLFCGMKTPCKLLMFQCLNSSLPFISIWNVRSLNSFPFFFWQLKRKPFLLRMMYCERNLKFRLVKLPLSFHLWKWWQSIMNVKPAFSKMNSYLITDEPCAVFNNKSTFIYPFDWGMCSIRNFKKIHELLTEQQFKFSSFYHSICCGLTLPSKICLEI